MTFLKKAEILGADLVALTGDYQQLKQQRDDLLARIHRDGGHYAEENGISKAIDDAHIKVAELYQQRDELLAELQKIAGTDFIGVPPRHVIYQITEIAREAIAKAVSHE